MGTEVMERPSLTASEIRAQVNLIQQVMEAVMKKDTHYGVIPGCAKPSLWKPGAEKLLVTFRIAPMDPQVADLSTGHTVRYRVTRGGQSIFTGRFVGSGIGECSSDEEKYKWRRPVCEDEFKETPEDRKREVWKKVDGKPTKLKQIRTNSADVANTILKMADKRAYVALTLLATAASDIFTQDIEDLPAEVAEAIAEEGKAKEPIKGPEVKKESSQKSTPEPGERQTDDAQTVAFVPQAGTAKPTKKEGQTRYAVKSPEGEWYSTFDDVLGAILTKAHANKTKVKVSYRVEGDFKNIVDVEKA